MDNNINIDPAEMFPTTYFLFQNYPNPFNPITTIQCSLPQSGDVTLKIYDVLGREVTRLVDKQLEAGRYSINWNASEFASGIYFYRLTVLQDGILQYESTNKILVLK